MKDDVTVLQINVVQADERTAEVASDANQLRENSYTDRDNHRQEIERIRNEYECALEFERNRVAALVEALVRKG